MGTILMACTATVDSPSDNIGQGKVIRGNGVKHNDECQVPIWQSHSKYMNNTFVDERNPSGLKMEGSVLDIEYPCTHGLVSTLGHIEKSAT